MLQPLNLNQKFFKSTVIRRKQKKEKEKIERRRNLRKIESNKDGRLKTIKSRFYSRRKIFEREVKVDVDFYLRLASLVQRGKRIN